MAAAFQWVKQHGIASEAAYSYDGRDESCDTSKEHKTVATVSGGSSVYGESGLKSAVSERAVSIGVDATCLQSYHGGILDKSGCSGTLDHGVLAVGYGTDGGIPYFKVKNSWGASWGENGYFRVVEGKGMLGIGKSAAYPTGVKSISPSPPGPSPGPSPSCDDTPPDSSATCPEQKEWGKCSRSWMKGYCCKSCFKCSTGCGKAVVEESVVPSFLEAMMPSLMHATEHINSVEAISSSHNVSSPQVGCLEAGNCCLDCRGDCCSHEYHTTLKCGSLHRCD